VHRDPAYAADACVTLVSKLGNSVTLVVDLRAAVPAPVAPIAGAPVVRAPAPAIGPAPVAPLAPVALGAVRVAVVPAFAAAALVGAGVPLRIRVPARARVLRIRVRTIAGKFRGATVAVQRRELLRIFHSLTVSSKTRTILLRLRSRKLHAGVRRGHSYTLEITPASAGCGSASPPARPCTCGRGTRLSDQGFPRPPRLRPGRASCVTRRARRLCRLGLAGSRRRRVRPGSARHVVVVIGRRVGRQVGGPRRPRDTGEQHGGGRDRDQPSHCDAADGHASQAPLPTASVLVDSLHPGGRWRSGLEDCPVSRPSWSGPASAAGRPGGQLSSAAQLWDTA
jgi:hypothetical protein